MGMTLYCFLGSDLEDISVFEMPDDGAGGQGVGRLVQSPVEWSTGKDSGPSDSSN